MQLLFLPIGDGTEQLDWVEFAHVLEDGDSYVFKYIDGEDESTTWPSELLSYFKHMDQGCHSILISEPLCKLYKYVVMLELAFRTNCYRQIGTMHPNSFTLNFKSF